jgi:hypothetical protein
MLACIIACIIEMRSCIIQTSIYAYMHLEVCINVYMHYASFYAYVLAFCKFLWMLTHVMQGCMHVDLHYERLYAFLHAF